MPKGMGYGKSKKQNAKPHYGLKSPSKGKPQVARPGKSSTVKTPGAPSTVKTP